MLWCRRHLDTTVTMTASTSRYTYRKGPSGARRNGASPYAFSGSGSGLAGVKMLGLGVRDFSGVLATTLGGDDVVAQVDGFRSRRPPAKMVSISAPSTVSNSSSASASS